jgi:hypothetical protein
MAMDFPLLPFLLEEGTESSVRKRSVLKKLLVCMKDALAKTEENYRVRSLDCITYVILLNYWNDG